MSEKQTNPNDDNQFLKKAALTGVGLISLSALGLGVNGQNEHNHEVAKELTDQRGAEALAYTNSIDAAINKEYDSKQVVNEIHVTQGSNLIDPAEAILRASLGDETYNEARGRLYVPLAYSADQYTPQPGETYYVVEADIDPEKSNGAEYLVTDYTHIIHTEMASIPSPIIEDSSTTEAHG